ncbi:MAG: response regulator [Verrucomicrobiota bacterium]
MKLLVVDDQEAVAMIVCEIAAQGGWEAIHTNKANDVPNLIKSEEIDILLIDYLMPEKNGLDVVSELRQAGETLPVILFSGETWQIDTEQAEALGVVQILQKPLSISELRKAMSAAVRMRRTSETT